MTKTEFALYLEELSYELRAFELNHEYLVDTCNSLVAATRSFLDDSLEYCRLKSVPKKDNHAVD